MKLLILEYKQVHTPRSSSNALRRRLMQLVIDSNSDRCYIDHKYFEYLALCRKWLYTEQQESVHYSKCLYTVKHTLRPASQPEL